MSIRYLSGINVDANTLFVDSVNDRVGIGTASPAYKLDVVGSFRSNALFTDASANAFWGNGNTATAYGFLTWDSGVAKVYATSGNRLEIGSNGSTVVTLSTTGNVGIGTTAPSYKTSVVAANGNYWDGTAFTGTPLALSIENSQAGGYDPVLIYNQADSGGTLKNSGAIGMVGTGPWTAGNNVSQVSDMYFLVRNSSGGISERLRIKSTGAAQLKAYGSGSFTGTVAYNLAVDSSGNIIETAGGVVDGSGTANYVSKWSDANTLTDSVIYDNGTNVGIGTTAPSAKLDVNGDINLTNYGSLTGGNSSNRMAIIKGTGASGNIEIGGLNNSDVIILTHVNERMRITSAGNVGIGTTSPADQLSISNSAGTSISITTGQAAGSIASPKFTDINFRGYLNTPMARIRSWDESSSTADGYLTFWTNDFDGVNNFTEKMRITPTGNVGIGTTSPAVKLHVAGTTETSIRVSDSGGSYMELYQQSTDSYILASNSLRFYNGGSERMRITSGGNVGIGTTSPAYKLDVAGTISNNSAQNIIYASYDAVAALFQRVGTYGGVIQLGRSGVSNSTTIDYPADGTFAVSTASSERMRITSAGNVGIGTTSPQDKLTVKGATNYNLNLGLLGGYSGIYVYNDASSAYNHLRIDASPLLLNSYSGGNVGIGTTSPSYKLDVNGSFGTVTSGIYLEYNSGILYHSGGSGNYYQYISGANYLLINRTATGALVFGTVDTERMRITSDGNVLIGTTTNSGEKLFVQGAGRFVNQLRAYNLLSDNQIKGSAYVELSPDQTTYNAWNIRVGAQAADACYYITGGGVNILTTEGYNNPYTVKLYSNGVQTLTMTNGSVRLNTYGSGSKTGTVAYNLAVDSSGNIIETAGGVVDGSGTANYVSKWSDANTLTNSVIYDNGTNITLGIGSAAASSTSAYGTAQFSVESNLFASSQVFTHNDTSGNYSFFALGKSKGTAAAPTIVESSEIVGAYQFWGYDGSAYREMASIVSNVDGTPDAGDMPGNLRFTTTSDGASSPTERMRITSAGNVLMNTTSSPTAGGFTNTTLSVKQLADGVTGGGLQIEQASTDNVAYFGFTGSVFVIGTSYRVSGSYQPIAFTTNGSERLRITNAGNVGIGTSSPTGHQLDIASTQGNVNNSAIRALYPSGGGLANTEFGALAYRGGVWTAVYGKQGSASSAGYFDGNVGIGTPSPANKLVAVADATFNGENSYAIAAASETDIAYKTIVGYDYANDVGVISAVRTGVGWKNLSILPVGNTNLGVGTLSPTERLHVSGNIRVTGAYYDSNNSPGTSGQVLSSTATGTDWVSLSEITGVDGTGTANYVAKWSDTDTIANSQIVDNGTNVGINNATPKTKLDINGAIGFGSKTMSMTDTFAAALTLNMNDHNGCYVKLTAFGDWSNHSTIAYLGEFFIQASAGAYNEPGIIIRQVDNTGGGDDIQAQIVDPAGTGTRDFVIQLKATSASNTPFTAYIQYEVRGIYNSVS